MKATKPKDISAQELASLYRRANNLMRNAAGLQPQETFDELLKYMFFKQINEEQGPAIQVQLKLMMNGSYRDDMRGVAGQIRSLFKKYVESVNVWSSQIWSDRKLHLSDETLFSLHDIFRELKLSDIPFDIRSAALKEFVAPEIRRGIGIYLTPDDVVRMMVNIVSPEPGSRVHDIAVGSGTFLRETLQKWFRESNKKKHEVWGTDINARMLMLADLNLGHIRNVKFHKRLVDALDYRQVEKDRWPKPNSMDYIFTNPPFGVRLYRNICDFSRFATTQRGDGRTMEKQQSEVVFIEQALRLLKPGGVLSIVLPRSVATNLTLRHVREVLSSFGFVFALVGLPSETFQTGGTQTTTMVLFIKKYEKLEDREQKIDVAVATVTNVGYDSTGRSRKGNELPKLSEDFALVGKKSCGLWKTSKVRKNTTFVELGNLLGGRKREKRGTKLGEIAEPICTGRTPARSDYTDAGLFLVKVGNLTGNGILWMARDRNFVGEKEAAKRMERARLMLRKYDILLTASAHAPMYIAKKVDIVWRIPEWVGGQGSFVGEVMLVRPWKDRVDPFVLLAYLRLPSIAAEIRRMIRGQTAHLHARDIAQLTVPPEVLRPDKAFAALAENLKKEVLLSDKLNSVMQESQELMERIDEGSDLFVDGV